MSSVCSAVQTIKSGNGSQTQFSFDFPYVFKSEIHVYFWNVTTKEYDEILTTDSTYPWQVPSANPTIVEFTGTAPPAPPATDTTANVKIRRITNIDDIQALFNPGSAIRSDDLNSNFEQLRFAIQESLCPDITEAEVTTYLQDFYWNNFEDTVYSTDTWTSSDTKLATTAAMDQRFQDEAAETITSTETWANDDNTIATTAAIDDQIDNAITNDIIISTDTGLTKSTSGGQITVGIGAGAVDLDRIKSDDIVATSAYSSTWTNEDDKVVTAGALAARHDLVVNTDVNPPSTTQTGKQWLSTAPGNQVHKIYDGSGWRTVAVGQPFSPATTTVVRYVDVTNGSDASDVTGFLPQAPLQSIGRALELINASSSGDGSLIKVAPGVYQETLPLRIKKNNISIVGESMRSCFVHPTVATENNDMFEVDSGSYIANLTLLGLKVPTSDQGSRNNSLDNDSTYGLPSNQPFSVRFRTDTQPTILKSPYIQNCTHFSDAHFDNANFDPNTFPSTDGQTYSAVAGDQSSAPCGGGLLVDGSAVSSSSPIRSMVVDAFTQITLDGPGILVTNNGYAQLVSFFGTFAHYHAKAKNGGQINLSNCVSDFGRYGLIADGKSPSAIATATASAANSGATTITIGAITTAGSFHGTVSRPLDHMMVTIDGVDYGVVSSTANGSGWDIVLTSGLTSNITNTTVSFALRSYISTGGHTFEFVGVGNDYGDLPDNGGVPVEANQVIELNGGKVWQSSTDHVGKFKAGNVLVVNQVSETVDLKATTVTGNITVTGTVDGRDVAADGTKLDGIETGATADQTATEIKTAYESNSDTNAFTDAEKTKLSGIAAGAEVNVNADWNASSGDAQILNKPTIPAAYTNSDVDSHLNQSTAGTNEVLSWNGSDYDWVAQSSGGLSDLVSDTTPQLGGNLDVNGNDIVSVSNGDIDLDPNGSGVVVFKGNATKGSGQFKLNCEQNSHGITIKGPPHSAAASYTLTLPNTDGNANEVLKTDGSGNLSWAAAASGGASDVDDLSDGVTYSSGNSIGLGTNALANDDGTANNNTALGYNSLNANTSGHSNVGVGHSSLKTNTVGEQNTALGVNAAFSNTNGYLNVAIGKDALYSNSTGAEIVAVGVDALENVTVGKGTAVGFRAGLSSTSAQDVTFIGHEAGYYCTTASYATAVGRESLKNLTTGISNTALGMGAGSNITTGSNCTVLGAGATASASTATNEITLGNSSVTSLRIPGLQSGATNGQVLTYNSTNGNITLADAGGGLSNNATTGTNNFGVGTNALDSNTASGANQNTAFGVDALTALNSDSADYNTAVGYGAGRAITTASDCTFLGTNTGESTTTGIKNVYLGSYAGGNKTTATSNVIIGYAAGAYNSSGSSQVFIGHEAGKYATGTGCVAIGFNALDASGCTGPNNTAVGYEALSLVTTGDSNTAVGLNAGNSITTGTNNLVLGYNADASSATVSDEITLGNASNTSLRIPGLQSGATNGQVLTYNSTNGNITLANGGLTNNSSRSGSLGIGTHALDDETTGADNTAVGFESQTVTSSGSWNTSLGSGALNTNGTGRSNTATGYRALYQNTTGVENVAVGYHAAQALTTATGVTAVGYEALKDTTTRHHSTAIGYRALTANTTGLGNTAVGYSTLSTGTTSGAHNFNTAVGYQSLANNTYYNNTGVGYRALYSNTNGAGNTAIGKEAGYSTTSGVNNTYLGTSAGYWGTTSDGNVAIGASALQNNTGAENVGIGYQAGNSVTTGSNLICIGYDADASSATATNEITLGNASITSLRIPGLQSGAADGSVLTYSSSTGKITLAAAGGGGVSDSSTVTDSTGLSGDGTALDAEQSGAGTYGDGNTAVGSNALTTLSTGWDNVAVGSKAGYSVSDGQRSVYVGVNAGYTNNSGRYQTFVGRDAGYFQTGNSNVAIGYQTLRGASGSSTGIYNVAVGEQAGYALTSGQQNTFVGQQAGEDLTTANYNVLVGIQAGMDLTTGNLNTCIGGWAGYNITTGANNTCLGKNAETSSSSASGEFVLGDTSISTLRCNTSTISSLSDGRDKTEVEDLPLGLDFIDTLRPVKFKWDTRDGNIKDGSYDAGFIAQDLQSAQSTSDAEYLNMVMDNNPDRLEARYGQLIPVLVQAIKDLKSEIETLKANA